MERKRVGNKYLTRYFITKSGIVSFMKGNVMYKNRVHKEENGTEYVMLYSSKDNKVHKYYIDVLVWMTFGDVE